MDYQNHWSGIYKTKAANDVSWYQVRPERSLEYIQKTGIGLDEPIIDVGAGASTLVDYLVAAHYRDITLLDISAEALAIARDRLDETDAHLDWIVGDITTVDLPKNHFALWHDRAVFHFLTDPAQQQRYVEQVIHALKPGGHLIIATFALDGPQQCSGLNVAQYDAESLQNVFGSRFRLIDSSREIHITPWGSEQRFIYGYFQKQSNEPQ